MPVIVMITLLATVIFLLTRENASGLSAGASERDKTRALYIAEAGIQHAIWQARNSNCGTYNDLANQLFGTHTYSVSVTPDTGSPINLEGSAVLAGGATGSMQAVNVPVYSATATTTVVLQPGPEGKDAYIRDKDKNNGASAILQVKDRTNALIQFDLSGLPPDAIITNARLDLYLEDGNGFVDGVFDLHRLTRTWVEGNEVDDPPPPGGGVTWDEYDGTNNWTTEGGDYELIPIVSVTLPSANLGWKEWVVTDQVQSWLGDQSNLGFLLRFNKDASANNADVEFTSSDGAADRRPRLTVSYVGCECGKDCVTETAQCDADFEPIVKDFEFDWMPGTNTVTGIDFLPVDLVVNGVTIPEGGGWIMADSGADDFFVTDAAGAVLTSFPVGQSDVRGVVYVEGGAWTGHLAFAEKNDDMIYLMDLDGAIQGSISTELIAEEPIGLTFIGQTNSGLYENHLAFTSKKNGDGEIYVIDQNGALQKTIVVESYAPDPQGVAHLAGADKLMVVDKDFRVSIIDFDGTVLNEYNTASWGLSTMHGATIHPETCEHVVLDKDLELVAGLSPFEAGAAVGPDVLMVVANADNLTVQEDAKKSLIESWGYTTTLLSDQSSSSAYDDAVAANDVVFIGEDVSSGQVDTKLTDALIGVVNEEPYLLDEFGMSTSFGWSSGTSVNIDDNSHYITQPFATGTLQILTSSSSLADLSETQAPGLEVLASTGAGPMLTTLEAGAEMVDASAAAGRRALLPWGGSNFDLGDLNDDGKTIFKRALEWATLPPMRCDADFAANDLVSEFPWMPNTGEIHGIDYLPAGLVVNSVTVPAAGGWIMVDNNKDRLFVTDLAGNTLTDFPILPPDSQGVALVDAGSWINHFAIIDKGEKRFYYLNMDGGLVWSYSLDGMIANPYGLGFVGSTESAVYDNHLAISSDKDATGGGTATIFIVDQWGVIVSTIDIETFAPTPQGVTHVHGADKLIVSDKAGTVSVIDFDGNLLHQYNAADFGLTELNEIAINPINCDHVFAQKKETESIVSLNRDNGDGSPRYFEMFMPWEVLSPDSWESVNLEIYGVPENAVVEVAIINSDGNELWGGARTVGSILERRLQLHEKDGGVEMMVMHVQTDANGTIELYSDKVDKVTFVFLGYWIETTYVENWQAFRADDDEEWENHALNGYGVGSNDVAEILMVNNAGFNQRKAGARTNGSSLARIVDLHEAKDGGDEAVSLMTPAGSDNNATIEVYADDEDDIDFYLLGHWSTPPGTYTTDFEDLGVPSTEKVWENLDLTSDGVPANAVAQILAANSEDTKAVNLGVRSKGSRRERMFTLSKALNGGDDVFAVHVNSDTNGVIQWYDEDLDFPRNFYLLGWWTLTP